MTSNSPRISNLAHVNPRQDKREFSSLVRVHDGFASTNFQLLALDHLGASSEIKCMMLDVDVDGRIWLFSDRNRGEDLGSLYSYCTAMFSSPPVVEQLLGVVVSKPTLFYRWVELPMLS